MNILLSCIGKRGYIADYFRQAIGGSGKVIGTSNTEWTPGFSSCDEAVILPPIASDEYIPALLETCQKYDVRGLLSFFDPDVFVLSAQHERFRLLGVTLVLPGREAVTICYDKLKTYTFCRENGLRTPETTERLDVAHEWLSSGRLAFPLIIKPRYGYGSANTFLAKNRLQLEAFFGYAEEMIVQEYLEAEAMNVDGLGDLQARPIAVIPWKKLLSRHGETERTVTIENPAILEHGILLIERLGIVGPYDADLFQDADGTIWTLEVNLRFGGGYPVSHMAGGEFPAIILRMLAGERISDRIGQYQRGVSMMKRLQIIPGPRYGGA